MSTSWMRYDQVRLINDLAAALHRETTSNVPTIAPVVLELSRDREYRVVTAREKD